ncbi:MAG: insulinase family protein, partial [bacterium]
YASGVVNVIYPVGLSEEKSNKVGVRYAYFYFVTKNIERKLNEAGKVCKVELAVENDYVNIKLVIPFDYQVSDILDSVKDYLKFRKIDFDEGEMSFVYDEVDNYYKFSLNSILWYFRQSIFSSHPYYFLALGNPKNIRYLRKEDFEDFAKSGIDPYFLVILSYNQEEKKVYDYIVSNFSKRDSGFKLENFNNDPLYLDRFYYRKVEIPRTRIFSLITNNEASYFLYIFTAPEFNKNFNEYVSMLVIDNFLSDTMDGVIWQELREKRGLIYSVYSEFPLLKYTSYYAIFTSCFRKNSSKVRNQMNRLIKSPPLDEQNIFYAKQRLANKLNFYLSSPESLSQSLVQAILYKDKRISPFYLGDYVFSVSNNIINQTYLKYFGEYYLFIFE